jgi:hypothetical protein
MNDKNEITMKKTAIILSVLVLILGGYGQVTKAQTAMVEKSTISKLRENFRHWFDERRITQEDYYANVGYIGLGLVNPKDIQFQLITDTPDRQKIEINIEEQELLIPLFWKPDYMLFYMTVVEILENQYRVRANNEMIVLVNKSEFHFYTWENLLKDQIFSIGVEIVYKEKDIRSQMIINPSLEENFHFTVQKMEGDWIYIRAKNYHTEEVKDYYWTRWKDENNKLLIKLYFFA